MLGFATLLGVSARSIVNGLHEMRKCVCMTSEASMYISNNHNIDNNASTIEKRNVAHENDAMPLQWRAMVRVRNESDLMMFAACP